MIVFLINFQVDRERNDEYRMHSLTSKVLHRVGGIRKQTILHRAERYILTHTILRKCGACSTVRSHKVRVLALCIRNVPVYLLYICRLQC